MNAYDIIIRPIISEKGMAETQDKKYVFEVAKSATKPQIKAAIEQVFKGAKVEKVNTIRYDGKPKRQGRTSGYTSSWKKAYVTLTPKSKPIEFFEGLK
ncbi:MAG: 50S ribosomal protein L23 [Firmicutes bacterium]|nr:50S ribosomal protein L23 [Bacillota bacterium]